MVKVTFYEPDKDGSPLTISLSIEEAINLQRKSARKSAGYEYELDSEALLDFIAVYWAFLEEDGKIVSLDEFLEGME